MEEIGQKGLVNLQRYLCLARSTGGRYLCLARSTGGRHKSGALPDREGSYMGSSMGAKTD